jgi:hypothetical protein
MKCLVRQQIICLKRYFEILNHVIIMMSPDDGETNQMPLQINDLSRETNCFDRETNPIY